MTERSLIPLKHHILSGSALKVLAVVFMLTDHIGAFLLKETNIVLVKMMGHTLTLYELTRYVGRLAFPLFAFLLVEGFLHTSDRKRYGLRLALFALISEIPWDLAVFEKLTLRGQNVFFTLLIGYLALCMVERLEKKPEERLQSAVVLAGLLLVSVFGRVDYGCAGLGFILMMYLLHQEPVLRALLGCCILPSRWIAGLSAVPIALYNGERGFIRSKAMKIMFYAIYPAHLLVLYGLRHWI